MNDPQTHLVPVTLPSRGDTFLDQSMAPKVDAFIAEAHKRGVNIRFNSAYRTPEQQEQLHHDPTAITPATHSLHSAGFAVGVEGFMRMSTHDQKAVREAAEAAGLKWGGGFRQSDPVHFYADPPIDRNTAIANATRQYHEYQQQHDHPSADQTNTPCEQNKPNHAPHDRHVLEQGARGHAVHDLQTKLTSLGYLDAKGVDGDFGLGTRHAVERFQHDHHLTVDGKVGPKTLKALDHVQASNVAPSLTDPKNPDNALYEQACAGVHQIDAYLGRTPNRQSDQLAAELAVAAKREGLTQINDVMLSEDGSRAFAVQGGPDSPLRQFAHVQTAEAVNTSIDKSSAAAQAVAPKLIEPAPTVAAPTHVPPSRTMSL